MLPVTIPSSTKDNRREQMTVVVQRYRTNLPHSVETRPWRIRTFGLWWSLVPTPASIVMSVPPAHQEHLSLGRLAPHLSLALPSLPVVCVAIHCLYPVRGEAEVNRQRVARLIARLALGIAVGAALAYLALEYL
jgi:hypothetical protein